MSIKEKIYAVCVENKLLKKIKKIQFFKYGKSNKENVFTGRKLKSKP